MRKSIGVSLTLLSLLASQVRAADLPHGTITLLPTCPGDDEAAQVQQSENEAGFVAALLTPLITGVVNHGLKAAGASLQEAAQEAQVDAIGTGDHFYTVDDNDQTLLRLKHHCVIVATKGTTQTNRKLEELARDYHAAKFTLGKDGSRTLTEWHNDAEPKALSAELKKAGYGDKAKPGVVVVFDVDLSSSRGDARLIPRFAFMDHSVREKANDSKARDVTFEVTFTAPSGAAPFGKEVFKFDSLKINTPRRRAATSLTSIATGQWFALPALPEPARNRITAANETKAQIATETTAAALALAAANKLLASGMPADCPAGGDSILKPWAAANAELVAEQTKPEKAKLPATGRSAEVLARLTQVVTFYGACQRLRNAQNKRDENKLKKGEQFLAFDIGINVKEFRERPAAKFFGAVLGDADVQKGVTTAVVNAVDPATRAAAQKAEDSAKLAVEGAYEVAWLEAEKARLGYESAKEEERSLKFLDMMAKQRAANRLADQLKMPRPYPDAGVWFTG